MLFQRLFERRSSAAGIPANGGLTPISRKQKLLSSLAEIAKRFGLGLFAVGIAAVAMTIVVHLLLLPSGGWTGPIA